MKYKLKKIPALMMLLFALLIWVFSLLKIGQFLNLVHIPVIAQVGVFVQSSAQSQVSEGGKASMKVTTDVNGQKQEVSSDKPGEIKITVQDGKTTTEVNTSPSPSPASTVSPSPIPMPNNQFKQMENQLARLWQTLLEKLSRFFKFA